jgi:hypothetical protein
MSKDKRIVILEICDCAMCPHAELGENWMSTAGEIDPDTLEVDVGDYHEICRCELLQNTMVSYDGEFPVPTNCPLPLKEYKEVS